VAAVPTTRARSVPTRPARTACSGNRRPKYIVVDLSAQHMWMCAHSRLARDTAITSGMTGPDTATPIGRFAIQGRNRDSVLTLANGDQYDVKYWIPFQAPLFGFHDSAWQRFPYGSPRYRTDGSHGCVHMPLAAIRFLYSWSDIGTTVRIRA
jgi:lipoprotein-anchoring transpeptidase ErfK/SrfK